MRIRLALALVASTGAVVAAVQRGPAQPPLIKENVTVKISEHVWEIPDGNVGLVPNVGIVVGTRATLVIDTGLGPRNAETVLKEVAKVSKNTELYLVATHYHPEHAGGSSGFPASTKFIVSKIQQQDIDELGMGMMQNFSRMSPLNGELLSGVQYRKADVIFDGQYGLHLGDVDVLLSSIGGTHTRGDTTAFVQQDRVLFSGDIALNKIFLSFSQQSLGQAWIDVLGRLEPLKPVTVIPSHGAVGDASVITTQKAVLQAIQARVGELKSQGKTADETAQTITAEFQAKYPDWTQPNRAGAAARTMYAEQK